MTSSFIQSFNRLHAVYRLIICLVLAVITFFFLENLRLQGLTKIMACWDVFATGMIIMSWITFFTTDSHDIRREVRGQDTNRSVIFLIVLVSALCSFLAIILLIINKAEGVANKGLHLPVSILGMALSWFLVHTIFTLRYGHLYYGDDEDQPETHAGGLDFPEEENPDYLDFSYFSFVIGMTFQVSDVQITSREIRRLVLLHGILSFCFNTVIVALSINVLAGLSG